MCSSWQPRPDESRYLITQRQEATRQGGVRLHCKERRPWERKTCRRGLLRVPPPL